MEERKLLKSAIECKAAAFLVLEKLCAKHEIVMPRVSFALRGGYAGVSYNGRRHIDFNLMLFRENFSDFIESVVPHELAHVYHEDLKLGGRPHGKEWKSVMRRFGFNAAIYHNYCVDFASSRTGFFSYRCGCGSHMVGLDLHRAMQAKPHLYQCEKCQLSFMYVS